MAENPNIRIDEIALKLGVSVRTTKSLIATLEQNGVIKRVNGKKYGY